MIDPDAMCRFVSIRIYIWFWISKHGAKSRSPWFCPGFCPLGITELPQTYPYATFQNIRWKGRCQKPLQLAVSFSSDVTEKETYINFVDGIRVVALFLFWTQVFGIYYHYGYAMVGLAQWSIKTLIDTLPQPWGEIFFLLLLQVIGSGWPASGEHCSW